MLTMYKEKPPMFTKEQVNDPEFRRLMIEKRRYYWDEFRGRYEEPTKREFNIIMNMARTEDFERDDFVEDEEWRSIEERVGIQSLRPLLIKTLHQLRESKGYDVESSCGVIFPFIPAKEARPYITEWAMEAARVAIDTINADNNEMMKKAYKLLKVENFVYASQNRTYLLTLNVEETDVVDDDDDADACAALKSIRAMVFDPIEGPKLLEWKFKQSLVGV